MVPLVCLSRRVNISVSALTMKTMYTIAFIYVVIAYRWQKDHLFQHFLGMQRRIPSFSHITLTLSIKLTWYGVFSHLEAWL
jgi:hypothetical protein